METANKEIVAKETKPGFDFRPGDTIKVHVKIREGTRERIQMFEGIVLKRGGRGESEAFTIRRIGVGGVGIERIWPVNSPSINEIDVIKRGSYRQSRIYFVRGLSSRQLAAASAAKRIKVISK
jgi:large subunit ribosomal protein L19